MSEYLERTPAAQYEFERTMKAAGLDPFEDDTPIVSACDLENPESCESCQ